jgi:hypothetical protein
MDRSLNESVTDKIRKYRADYNNNPPNAISFMPAIAITSGRLHSESVRLLFLQDHRETDRFFATSGVQLAQLVGFLQVCRQTGVWRASHAMGSQELTQLLSTYVLLDKSE